MSIDSAKTITLRVIGIKNNVHRESKYSARFSIVLAGRKYVVTKRVHGRASTRPTCLIPSLVNLCHQPNELPCFFTVGYELNG